MRVILLMPTLLFHLKHVTFLLHPAAKAVSVEQQYSKHPIVQICPLRLPAGQPARCQIEIALHQFPIKHFIFIVCYCINVFFFSILVVKRAKGIQV